MNQRLLQPCPLLTMSISSFECDSMCSVVCSFLIACPLNGRQLIHWVPNNKEQCSISYWRENSLLNLVRNHTLVSSVAIFWAICKENVDFIQSSLYEPLLESNGHQCNCSVCSEQLLHELMQQACANHYGGTKILIEGIWLENSGMSESELLQPSNAWFIRQWKGPLNLFLLGYPELWCSPSRLLV